MKELNERIVHQGPRHASKQGKGKESDIDGYDALSLDGGPIEVRTVHACWNLDRLRARPFFFYRGPEPVHDGSEQGNRTKAMAMAMEVGGETSTSTRR